MAEESDLRVEAIEIHLRKLGLTEAQILLHVAPLKKNRGKRRQKLARSREIWGHVYRSTRKPILIP
jgi:hypothetical protein